MGPVSLHPFSGVLTPALDLRRGRIGVENMQSWSWCGPAHPCCSPDPVVGGIRLFLEGGPFCLRCSLTIVGSCHLGRGFVLGGSAVLGIQGAQEERLRTVMHGCAVVGVKEVAL